MKPKILILANQRKENYIKAIKACGAIGTLKYLPDTDSVTVTDFDGLLICGGNDIHPSNYGQEINGSVNFDTERDRTELALIKQFMDTGRPILGICRGHQLLNVALGGTLIQDLEAKAIHTQINATDQVHKIKAKEKSTLYSLYGEEFYVNSAHHQGIDKLGSSLVATSFCGDVIESIEHKIKPYLGVQFHPERMTDRQDTVNGIEIFEYFVSLCKKQ